MLKKKLSGTGLFLVCLASLLAACASPKTKSDARTRVQDAERTLASFQQDPGMKAFQQHMKDAKAVLVAPDVLQAGFIVGGAGGAGVVLARGGHGWNGPAFYKVATGTLGLQAGAQSSEVVMLFMTQKAVDSLLSSSFKLGGDVSVSAGSADVNAATGITSDVITYARSKGLYAGLNLDGTSISVDEDGNKAFYGKPASAVDILVKRSVSSPDAMSLQRAAGQ